MIFTSFPSRIPFMRLLLLPVIYTVFFMVPVLTVSSHTLYAAESSANNVEVPGTYGDAMRWYERSAKAGNARAQFYLGMLYEQGLRGKPDAKSAISWFTKAAEQGHRQAQLKLGLLYYKGTLVEKNFEQAAHWFEKAAAQSSSQANYNLALMLVRGLGVTKDAKRAAAMFEKVVDRGINEAALHLAVLYGAEDKKPGNKSEKKSDNLKQDKLRALMWLEWAKGKGLAPDPAFFEKLTESMTESEIKKARALALKRLKK
jgi:TPR repeat protein